MRRIMLAFAVWLAVAVSAPAGVDSIPLPVDNIATNPFTTAYTSATLSGIVRQIDISFSGVGYQTVSVYVASSSGYTILTSATVTANGQYAPVRLPCWYNGTSTGAVSVAPFCLSGERVIFRLGSASTGVNSKAILKLED